MATSIAANYYFFYGDEKCQIGFWGANSQNPCSLAKISQMFDVLNKITVDAIIAPKSAGERELCESIMFPEK